MANLNEYLGTIVSSLSQARVLADLESAKIALTYAENDLLRHFSIPRMRIDDVELTIPVAVSGMDNPAGSGIPAVNVKHITELALEEVIGAFDLRSLPVEGLDSIRKEISVHIEDLAQKIKKENLASVVTENVADIAETINKRIEGFVEKGLIKRQNAERQREITAQFRESLTRKLKSDIARGPIDANFSNLTVVMESDKLRERNPATLIVIKMKVSEESMEWERIDAGDGKTVTKLMPS